MLSAGGILSIIHFLPLVVIFAIVGLELAIAFFTGLRFYGASLYLLKRRN